MYTGADVCVTSLAQVLSYIINGCHCYQGAGLGRLNPNVLLMGFKSDWQSGSPHAAHSYIGILQWVCATNKIHRMNIVPCKSWLPVFQRCLWSAVWSMHHEDEGGTGSLSSISVTQWEFSLRFQCTCRLLYRYWGRLWEKPPALIHHHLNT